MAAVPGAGAEVFEEVGEASFGSGGVELGEAGDAGADDGVEVGLGSGPEGAEEAVGAVAGDGDGADVGGAEEVAEAVDRDGAVVVGVGVFGEVVADKPEVAGDALVPGEDDGATGDATDLGEAGFEVGPVVDGEGAERGVDGVVGERDAVGGGDGGGGEAGRALRDHDHRGFDGEQGFGRFVGAGAGTDVDDGARALECCPDGGLDLRVWLPCLCVGGADLVVDGGGAGERGADALRGESERATDLAERQASLGGLADGVVAEGAGASLLVGDPGEDAVDGVESVEVVLEYLVAGAVVS